MLLFFVHLPLFKFVFFNADFVHQVLGVDIVDQAITDANDNAERNGIQNAKFFAGKTLLATFYMSGYDVMLLSFSFWY